MIRASFAGERGVGGVPFGRGRGHGDARRRTRRTYSSLVTTDAVHRHVEPTRSAHLRAGRDLTISGAEPRPRRARPPSARGLRERAAPQAPPRLGPHLRRLRRRAARLPGVKVVILCGGRGTRLQEQTQSIPKPLVEIGGMPIVWHVVQLYASQGWATSCCACGYKAEMIAEFVAASRLARGRHGALRRHRAGHADRRAHQAPGGRHRRGAVLRDLRRRRGRRRPAGGARRSTPITARWRR